MRIRHLAAALAAVLLSTPASAEIQLNLDIGPRIALYGRVVGGVDFIDNVADDSDPAQSAGSLVRGGGNQWGTSLFGLAGYQDLAGGATVLMLLESGFDTGTGQFNGDGLWDRRAYVGFSHDDYGKLTFGKNLFIANDIYILDPMIHEFMSTSTLSRGRAWPISNRVVEYRSPSWQGFELGIQHAFGGVAGDVRSGQMSGASLKYSHGPLELLAIYDTIRDADGGYSDLFRASREVVLGATLSLGKVKLYTGIQDLSAPQSDAANPNSTPTTNGTDNFPVDAKHAWFGAEYRASEQLVLRAALYSIRLDDGMGNATLYTAGADYHVSDAAFVYLNVGAVNNVDEANFAVEATDERPPIGETQAGVYSGVGFSF